jgi:pimeloyl-ACP methyl ester carboxylesterase
MAEVEPGLRFHYASAAAGERTVVLLHGLPQTWYEWRHVLSPVVDAGSES